MSETLNILIAIFLGVLIAALIVAIAWYVMAIKQVKKIWKKIKDDDERFNREWDQLRKKINRRTPENDQQRTNP